MNVLHVRLPVELKQAVDRVAAEQRRTIAATVQLALEQYVATSGAKPAARGRGERIAA